MSLRFKNVSEARKTLGDRALKRSGVLVADSAKSNPATRKPKLVSDSVETIKSPPHKKLWDAVLCRFAHFDPAVEYKNSVPNRRFSLDIAFPRLRLAVEVDGWQYHGKFKKGFLEDRKKQNLLVQHNWRVLRFTAGQIFADIDEVIRTIEAAIINAQKSHENDPA